MHKILELHTEGKLEGFQTAYVGPKGKSISFLYTIFMRRKMKYISYKY